MALTPMVEDRFSFCLFEQLHMNSPKRDIHGQVKVCVLKKKFLSLDLFY